MNTELKIKLVIGDKEHELTQEQAKELHGKLDALFGDKTRDFPWPSIPAPVYPIIIEREPQWPTYPLVTYTSGSFR